MAKQYVNRLLICANGHIYLYLEDRKLLVRHEDNYGEDGQWFVRRADSDDFKTVKAQYPNASLSYETRKWQGVKKFIVEKVETMEKLLPALDDYNKQPTQLYDKEPTFERLFADHQEWYAATFDEPSIFTPLHKLQAELIELVAEIKEPTPNLPFEFVDCLMCLISLAKKNNVPIEAIKAAFILKLEKNKSDKWRKNEDGTYSRIKLLTVERLNEMKDGERIDTGVGHIPGLSHKEIRWVAVRGSGHSDWAIYYHLSINTAEWVRWNGDKATTEKIIRDLVPCTDAAFALYRT